jgi:hypothetical protein
VRSGCIRGPPPNPVVTQKENTNHSISVPSPHNNHFFNKIELTRAYLIATTTKRQRRALSSPLYVQYILRGCKAVSGIRSDSSKAAFEKITRLSTREKMRGWCHLLYENPLSSGESVSLEDPRFWDSRSMECSLRWLR